MPPKITMRIMEKMTVREFLSANAVIMVGVPSAHSMSSVSGLAFLALAMSLTFIPSLKKAHPRHGQNVARGNRPPKPRPCCRSRRANWMGFVFTVEVSGLIDEHESAVRLRSWESRVARERVSAPRIGAFQLEGCFGRHTGTNLRRRIKQPHLDRERTAFACKRADLRDLALGGLAG